ncbi:MAG: PAS domain-containing sensor histidine kinase [Curvibacter sp. RIFCSPHIGHO2_12_FULL_63_18]|uniref:sensor histidine kinase n=1 Tax=Rhodoferax sp. TaxID=50421 RepID=UPI0008C486E7|nr:ATP-binding protein [Rhodoferax sp.]OGO98918.1 MAG: PAS domain-containing sensor histidine kinase [Curvibacter sp. GWA2_63_95]OGP06280.1 MAG: PAS domain-containing sensor histidine kinase [Curvibacter sp. RIFCSPHIGHO2_12_FULL_63_18]HCX83094.1 PAS domain-containing sensor histidine kinase [Rhodoferax sp.]
MKPAQNLVANPGHQTSRAVRRAVALGAAAMVLIGLLLLYLLTQATNNRELYEQNYARLFVVNVVVATLLGVAIAWVGYRLMARLRQGRFGSRLLVKLATIFALVGVMPGLLIYVVSYQFVSRSIETWFDVKVEGALEAGLSLGRVTLETLSSDLATKSRAAASQLVETSDSATGEVAERLLDQLGATDITVWSGSGKLISSVGLSRFQLSPDKPSSSQFRAARQERALAWVEGLEDAVPGALANAQIKALVPVSSSVLGLSAETRYMLVSRTLPTGLVANALAVEAANREYQERALAREGLKRMYIGTLTLSLFLAVFGAVLLAVVLGNQIAKPLLLLTEGVSQVAAGDLTPKLAMQGRDELGGLTRAFASMTQQLADARLSVEASMSQVDAARANLQTILDNLTSGVVVLAPDGRIVSSNPGATRILQLPLTAYEGQLLSEVPGLQTFGDAVQNQFAQYLTNRAEHGLDHWQQSFELGGNTAIQSPFERAVTLVARGAELPSAQRLLVFDDISEIVSAQRAQAWGEVARRLAHEIKNPLTPIQLSAERMEMKLAGKLEGVELGILTKSVKTIVDQVDAMKRLVNEFRDYARLPSAELKPVDLNALVRDVLQLYESDVSKVVLVADLDEACPPVRGDAQQLRQVIHNLVQNAQDATESATLSGPGRVVLRTQHLAVADRVRLSVQDQGTGFPEHILKRAFEPYVTTKTKGTGLGLAVVKKIADEHGTRVDITNRTTEGKVTGAQVSLSLAIDHSAQG